ncbi:unnamed protein product [marine sediment metagenome]|uniref:Uncharacterized protein n=1 Tax=marine sediment metagenome TaxID=412755 RepID=X0UWT4_9ZZZZ
MNSQEFEERLERLGPSPVDPDLAPLVRYLLKRVNILTSYLVQQPWGDFSVPARARLSSGRFAPRQSDAEEAPE